MDTLTEVETMYDTRGSLPVDSFPPGTTLLFHGPPMAGIEAVVNRLLAAGLVDGEGAVVVATEQSAADVYASLEGYVDDPTGAVGVVDTVGDLRDEPVEETGPVRRVATPADLTGVSIELSSLLDRVPTESGYRLAVGSLTPFVVYRDFETVFQFVQSLTGSVADSGGLCILQTYTDVAADDELERLRGLVDGVVEFRDRDGSAQLRLIGPDRSPGEWRPVEGTGQTTTRGRSSSPRTTRTERVGSDVVPERVRSLSSLIDRVIDRGQTLTLANFDGTDDQFDRLANYFDTFNVTIREASLDRESPRDVAMLHSGDRFRSAAPVQSLLDAMAVEGGEDGFETVPELLAHVNQSVFGTSEVWRQALVRTSRLVELTAMREATGTLHAGFQSFSRFGADDATRELYRQLSDLGVTVHVYGRPDADPPDSDRFVLHPDRGEEITRSWFVVYESDRSDRAAALVAEEREPRCYHGFWTHRPENVTPIRRYLETTYVDGQTEMRA
jgi:KaiC/GvpD/RAD55 family RecA-like ATPase